MARFPVERLLFGTTAIPRLRGQKAASLGVTQAVRSLREQALHREGSYSAEWSRKLVEARASVTSSA
jgi:hypothetical protein